MNVLLQKRQKRKKRIKVVDFFLLLVFFFSLDSFFEWLRDFSQKKFKWVNFSFFWGFGLTRPGTDRVISRSLKNLFKKCARWRTGTDTQTDMATL